MWVRGKLTEPVNSADAVGVATLGRHRGLSSPSGEWGGGHDSSPVTTGTMGNIAVFIEIIQHKMEFVTS